MKNNTRNFKIVELFKEISRDDIKKYNSKHVNKLHCNAKTSFLFMKEEGK